MSTRFITFLGLLPSALLLNACAAKPPIRPASDFNPLDAKHANQLAGDYQANANGLHQGRLVRIEVISATELRVWWSREIDEKPVLVHGQFSEGYFILEPTYSPALAPQFLAVGFGVSWTRLGLTPASNLVIDTSAGGVLLVLGIIPTEMDAFPSNWFQNETLDRVTQQ